MTNFLLFLVGCECLAIIAWGLKQKHRILSLPFLSACLFGGLLFPQFCGVVAANHWEAGFINASLLMSALCLAMTFLGWVATNTPVTLFRAPLDYQKATRVTLVLTLLGVLFSYKLRGLPTEMLSQAWTGLPVAYLFFMQAMSLALVPAFLLYFRTKSPLMLGVVGLNTLVYLDAIIFAGRRTPAAEAFLLTVCAFWFGKQKMVPRSVVIAVIIIGSLFFHSVTEYRVGMLSQVDTTRGISEKIALTSYDFIKEIGFVEKMKATFQEGGSEANNAVAFIAYSQTHNYFDLGRFHWNDLVFRFVPAQLVGREFKDALRLGGEDPDPKISAPVEIPPGTASTGIASAFASFGYFGAGVFFVVAFMMRKIYLAAVSGAFACQVLYATALISALHQFPHHSNMFLDRLAYLAVFLLPAYYYARRLTGTPKHARRNSCPSASVTAQLKNPDNPDSKLKALYD